MIEEEVKKKLIEELRKEGNVFIACAKVGIDRTTPYRWEKEDKRFKKLFREAIRLGRESTCEIAEHSLMIAIKNGNLGAIKYLLSHNSGRYKRKSRKVVITYSHENLRLEEERKKFEQEKREYWNLLSEKERIEAEAIFEKERERIGKNQPPDIMIKDDSP